MSLLEDPKNDPRGDEIPTQTMKVTKKMEKVEDDDDLAVEDDEEDVPEEADEELEPEPEPNFKTGPAAPIPTFQRPTSAPNDNSVVAISA